MIWLLLTVFITGAIIFFYMYSLSEKDHLRITSLPCARLSGRDNIQLLFISDIHNRRLKESTFEEIREVDIVIIGGDLVDKRTSEKRLKQNLSILKQWGAPIYFIPGNNDHEWKYGSFLEDLEKECVLPLSNEDTYIEHGKGTSFVVSALDPYFMKPNRNASHPEDSQCLQILCVHDPYVFQKMNAGAKKRFDLVLSGHTHGGQIRILGFGPYKRGGWEFSNEQSFLVSEGYGTSLLPLRLGTRAECHWIELVPKEGEHYSI